MTLWPPAGYSVFCPPCVYCCCASDSASHLYILPVLVSRPFSCSPVPHCVLTTQPIYILGCQCHLVRLILRLVLAYLVRSKGPAVCLPGSCRPGSSLPGSCLSGSCLFLAFALCLLPDSSEADLSFLPLFGLFPRLSLQRPWALFVFLQSSCETGLYVVEFPGPLSQTDHKLRRNVQPFISVLSSQDTPQPAHL